MRIRKVHDDGRISVWGEIGELDHLEPAHVLRPNSRIGGILRKASANGEEKLVVELLQAGVSPFEATADARTPLHLAASAGHTQVCKTLVLASAHPHVQDGQQHTAFERAVESRHSEVRRVLEACASDMDVRSATDGDLPILALAAKGTYGLQRALEQQRKQADSVSVNSTDTAGITLLMLAARAGEAELVTQLIAAKADVNAISTGHACS
eukprot:5218167-Prymnesium_polylepis.1